MNPIEFEWMRRIVMLGCATGAFAMALKIVGHAIRFGLPD